MNKYDILLSNKSGEMLESMGTNAGSIAEFKEEIRQEAYEEYLASDVAYRANKMGYNLNSEQAMQVAKSIAPSIGKLIDKDFCITRGIEALTQKEQIEESTNFVMKFVEDYAAENSGPDELEDR